MENHYFHYNLLCSWLSITLLILCGYEVCMPNCKFSNPESPLCTLTCLIHASPIYYFYYIHYATSNHHDQFDPSWAHTKFYFFRGYYWTYSSIHNIIIYERCMQGVWLRLQCPYHWIWISNISIRITSRFP